MKIKGNLLLAAILLALSACQMPQANPSPESRPGAHYTEAAQTVSVQLTAAGIGKPAQTAADETPQPQETSESQPSETFVFPSFTPAGEANGTPVPCDQVRFVKDVTIPDDMDLAPGEAFTKTWRLENAGSCPWTIGYLLYFESGDIMGGPSSQDLTSAVIQPGETVDVSVNLVAPQETGTYEGFWKIRNVKGEGFGVGAFSKAFWVRINVVEGAGMMFDFNIRANQAAWGSGKSPVDYIDLGGKILNFDAPGDDGDAYVGLLDQQFLEGGRISGILLATYPPQGVDRYVIGRFPNYKVNGGDLLFGRVGLVTNASGNCGKGDVTFRINLMQGGDPATRVTLWEWDEVCDGNMKSFEIDLDDYKGQTVQIFLVVISNNDSDNNFAVWDSLSIHR
jgi:hypothetical protein